MFHGISTNSDPKAIEETIEGVKALLVQHPSLRPETILDEWNMALTVPPTDARVQPTFVAETAWRMKASGLTYSCFYHIRDYHVDRERFAPFFSPAERRSWPVGGTGCRNIPGYSTIRT